MGRVEGREGRCKIAPPSSIFKFLQNFLLLWILIFYKPCLMSNSFICPKSLIFFFRDNAMSPFYIKQLAATCFFYKHIKIQGLGSDMLKATQNIGWKYAYDMLILCVKIINFNSTFYNICLFWSNRPELFLQIDVPANLPKSLKNTCEGVHLLVKL